MSSSVTLRTVELVHEVGFFLGTAEKSLSCKSIILRVGHTSGKDIDVTKHEGPSIRLISYQHLQRRNL